MRLPLVLAPFVFLGAACATEVTGDAGDEARGEVTSSVTGSCKASRAQILASVSGGRRTAIARGFTWLDADVPYSQSASYEGYRTDCSGFVSMCWETGTSYTTLDFSNGGGASSKLSSYDDLLPGDALVRRSGGSGHVVLFLGWNDAKQTAACVLEQASTKSDMQFGVRSTSSLKSGGFKAIRADKLDGESAVSASGAADDDAIEAPAADDVASEDSNAADPSSGGARCASDGACNPGNNGSGLICVGGRCVTGCKTDAHCPGIQTCEAGKCQ